MHQYPVAPELTVSHWLNTDSPLYLSELKGKVVVIHTFQMLCPGCVSYGLPQAEKLTHFFQQEDVVVIGLHTVFEHHEAMQLESLKAFVHEYRLSFPIAVDAPSSNSIPITMGEYQLAGTPSLVIIDKNSKIRFTHHGAIDDMLVSKIVSSLVLETNSVNNDIELEATTSTPKQSDRIRCSVN
ncbi:peroxiredoxin family protein [Vibrio sagamiensis]|uniref:Thioredoxin domain-containing protein n=1 Tax=Vibrio sagamiensis NBRC 104589 TaxID=1219064 RepID=A0A511QJA0_9VIBR|nr:redoxin family protein [Vibrio sagamiensis]PNQ58654.1 alkyl hydroperoxide reductase [Vibrio agarivorans]GEM77267.1 hypothetical protein VSA01S_33790 [Vibrio sagamiensis NBRC 104589]